MLPVELPYMMESSSIHAHLQVNLRTVSEQVETQVSKRKQRIFSRHWSPSQAARFRHFCFGAIENSEATSLGIGGWGGRFRHFLSGQQHVQEQRPLALVVGVIFVSAHCFVWGVIANLENVPWHWW